MRRGKQRSETLIPEEDREQAAVAVDDDDGDVRKGFFACYLLCSLCPRYKGHTYIGFTVNPRRRIRQHNGEIRCGAWRTKSKRPWEMILCIYGFPSNVSALQFEWAWQHPRESLAVRKAAAGFKTLSGIGNKIKLAYTMLTLPPWENLNLTINFFSTKHIKHSACCPSLPKHMKVNVRAMDDLPCYFEGRILDGSDDTSGDEDIENVDGDTSASIDTSANPCLEDGHLFGWMESDDLRGQWELPACHSLGKSSQPVNNEKRTLHISSGMESDDYFRQIESLKLKELVAHPEPSHLILSSKHINKEIATVSRNILSSVNEEPLFECTNEFNMAQLTQMSSPPRADNNVISCPSLLSPESNVIDLSTPSSCIVHLPNRRASVHPEIIDLTDSPICIQL